MTLRAWIDHLVLAIALAALCATAVPSYAQAPGSQPATVILVRHAEPALQPPDDPGLSPAGAKRAQDLAAALRDAGVTSILTSLFRRTRETAQPLARQLGIAPDAAPILLDRGRITPETLAGHVRTLAAGVQRRPGGVILIVGHSNTIPDLIFALGGPRLADICEPVFDNLFVLTPAGGKWSFTRARYGAPSPDAGLECR